MSTDVLLALHAAANACAAAATASGFSEEQAANGQAVVDQLRAIFWPRPTTTTGTALESDAPLLAALPREIVTAILHRLDTRTLGRLAATCRALYRPAPPQQESVVAVTLQERALHRGAGPAALGVPDLLRREWRHTLTNQPPLLASAECQGEMSAFIDSDGRLLTCGTEGVEPEDPVLSQWVNAIDDPDHEADRRVLLSPTVVPAMRNLRFRSVASGADGCLAVSSVGEVYSWGGEGGYGNLGHDEPPGGTVVDGLAGVRVRSVSMGSSIANPVFAAVTENGLLYTWGSILDVGEGGPSGIGYPASEADDQYVHVPRQVNLSGVCVRSVALGFGYSLILADDGRLFSCGCAEYGVLGHGDEEHDVVRPKQIEALNSVRVCSVAADSNKFMALTTDGKVYSWGIGSIGVLSIEEGTNNMLLPTLVEALTNKRVSMVAAGGSHACAVTEAGALFTWGLDGRFGSLGHGDESAQLTPRRVEALRGCRIATAATGDYHTLAVGEDGSVYGFGLSSRLGFGTASHESQLTPKRVPNLKVWLG